MEYFLIMSITFNVYLVLSVCRHRELTDRAIKAADKAHEVAVDGIKLANSVRARYTKEIIECATQAREEWLADYDNPEGADVVTPYDKFLYQPNEVYVYEKSTV